MGAYDLIVTVMVLAFTALVIARWRRDLPKVTEPSCGKCHYAVRQLPTSICPECGSNLDEVGILYPERRSIAALAIELISVTVLLLAGLIIIGNAVPLPRLVEWDHRVILTPTDKSAAYRFEIVGVVREWRIVGPAEQLPPAPAGPSLMFLEYKPLSGSGARVELNANQAQHAFVNGDGRRRTIDTAFDSKASLTWLNSLGVTGPSAGEQAEILAKVASLGVDALAVDNYLGPLFIAQGNKVALVFSGASSGRSVLSDRWMLRAGIVVIVLLWLAYARKAIRRAGPCRPCAA